VRRRRVEQFRNHFDVPQPDLSGFEHGRCGGQAGWKWGAVEPDAGTDLLGGVDPAVGFGSFPTEQIGQGPGGGFVAAFGERPAAVQRRDGGEGEPVQPSGDALADGERGQQFGVGGTAGFRGCGQRADRLFEEAMRFGDRAVCHALDSSRTTVRSKAFCRR
jgi:hypothetical protein